MQVVYAADTLEVTKLVIFLVLIVSWLAHDTLIKVVVRQLQEYALVVLSRLQAILALSMQRHLSRLIRVAFLLRVGSRALSMLIQLPLAHACRRHLASAIETKAYQPLVF